MKIQAAVYCAVRVGGLSGRLLDETAALAEGVIGQETTGAGGITFALRTVPVVTEIAEVVHDTAEAASRLMVKLPKMRDLRPELAEIDQLESRGDDLYRRTLARLFSGEFKAFTVLRWKDVVEAFESALNSFEKMSDIVASISAKHS